MTRDPIQESYLAAVATALSPVRLRLGFRISPREPDSLVLARYLWNVALREALYPVLHILEITLRNRLDALHGTASEAIGWISPELRETAIQIDRFPSVHARGEDFFLRVVERMIAGTG